ncbi:MAG: hypothetical protein LBE91_00545 [Tannerella sp.]|nr:hypothetical protein [Tannerella sp.]
MWTVKDSGTTGASITGGNTLTATAAGTVTVTATIPNGATPNTPFSKDFTISVKTNLVVSGVTVSPDTSDVPKGYALEFKATVAGNNLTEADKAVTWTVTGGTNQETSITADGTLVVSAAETAETLTIKATSTVDNSKSGTATVKIYEYQNFHEPYPENVEIVEITFMGEKIKCCYINGQYIIQGDIILQDDNQNVEINSLNTITPRAATITDYQTWSQGKVFHYSEIPNDNINKGIREAIKEIQDKTNTVKFIELKTEEAKKYKKTNLIKFVPIPSSDPDQRNRSYIGWRSFGNTIWLKDPDASLHEICHALGLIHEHSRPDRVNNIIIWRNNMDISDEIFDIDYNIDGTLAKMIPSSKFDFKSVMMYDSYSHAKSKDFCVPFTKCEKATITDKDGKTYADPSKIKLSDNDVQVLNQMYHQQNATPDVFIHPDNGNNIHPTENSCLLSGELIYEGFPANYLTEYGICYRIKGNTAWKVEKATSKDNLGRFTCALGGLEPNKTYEAGAYYKFNGDTHYNLESKVEFTTLPGTPVAPEIGTWRGSMSFVNLINNQKMSYDVELLINLDGTATWKETTHEPYLAYGNALYTEVYYMYWIRKNNYIEFSYNVQFGGIKPDGSPFHGKTIPCIDKASLDATNTIMSWEGIRPFTSLWDFELDDYTYIYEPFKGSLRK